MAEPYLITKINVTSLPDCRWQVDAGIDISPLYAFLHKLNKISTENNIDFYLSISADKKDIPGIDSSDCTVVS